MPELATRTESNVFSLYVRRLNTVYDSFERRMADHIATRVGLGADRNTVLLELLDDLENETGIFSKLGSDAKYEVDFGTNQSYQVASNEGQAKDKVIWQLDPEADHCDSCLAQANMGERTWDEVPFPGMQPTIGETNCERYCKCTLIPASNT